MCDCRLFIETLNHYLGWSQEFTTRSKRVFGPSWFDPNVVRSPEKTVVMSEYVRDNHHRIVMSKPPNTKETTVQSTNPN